MSKFYHVGFDFSDIEYENILEIDWKRFIINPKHLEKNIRILRVYLADSGDYYNSYVCGNIEYEIVE